MRLTYILAVVVAATFHTSVAAFSPVQDSKAATENGAAATVVDSAEGGRLLRRVDDDSDDHDDDLDDDSFDEERGFVDVLKKANPLTSAKTSTKATKKSMTQLIEESEKLKKKHFEKLFAAGRRKAVGQPAIDPIAKARAELVKRIEAAKKLANK